MVSELHRPRHPVRFITAASLFDGHDAAINIMRRLLQSQGAEVIHLGHNRSVDAVVTAAIAEDVQGVAISSYQGGHMEYFRYLVDRLRAEGRGDILVYGGGGGVIVPSEIEELEAYGVRRIFSPSDGQLLGLDRMINFLIEECDRDLATGPPPPFDSLLAGDHRTLARWITHIEGDTLDATDTGALLARFSPGSTPVLGITGTGGSGKSSLTDELIRRFRLDQEDKLAIAVLAVDPTRRRGGGALLGDRIRMNAIDSPNVFFRSLATRGSASELPARFPLVVAACGAAGFDLVIVETPGIGQGDAAVTDIADVSLYVMTPEYGAASQLEKIGMLELADAVAINKFDRRGAEDAFRQVCRQWGRDHAGSSAETGDEPVFGTIASRFNDDGVTALFHRLKSLLVAEGLVATEGVLTPVDRRRSTHATAIIPSHRRRYLSEIAETVEGYHATTNRLAEQARRAEQVAAASALGEARGIDTGELGTLAAQVDNEREPEGTRLLEEWAELRSALTYGDDDSEPDGSGADGSRARPRGGGPHCRVPVSPGSPSHGSPNTGSWSAGCGTSTCPVTSPSPPACSRISARVRTRPGCSPVKVTPSAPTAGSTSWPRASPPPACPRPSTR